MMLYSRAVLLFFTVVALVYQCYVSQAIAQPAAPSVQQAEQQAQQSAPQAQQSEGQAPQPQAQVAPQNQVVPAPSTQEATPTGAGDTAAQPLETPGTLVAPEATLPHDLSPWGMFLAADIVVKSVMIGLVLASVAVWAVWFAKSLGFSIANKRLRRSLELVNAASSLSDAAAQASQLRGLGRHLIQSAAQEFGAGATSANTESLKERIALRLDVLSAVGAREVARGTGLLASVGSVAPFVGLFGTVWGIMNSFIGISKTQTTNLAVVAPGIAEALLATAIGLFAAIPAVIFYNQFARAATRYKLGLNELASGVKRLVLRELEAKAHRPGGTGSV